MHFSSSYLVKSLSTSYSYLIHVLLYTKNSRKARIAMRLNAIRDTRENITTRRCKNSSQSMKYECYSTFYLSVICTCPTAGCRLHIALRNFGESVQLPHKTQSLLLGQPPHLSSSTSRSTRVPSDNSLIKVDVFCLFVNADRRAVKFIRSCSSLC